jgi:hypothetical protein
LLRAELWRWWLCAKRSWKWPAFSLANSLRSSPKTRASELAKLTDSPAAANPPQSLQ